MKYDTEKIHTLGKQLEALHEQDKGLYKALFVDERPVQARIIPSELLESMKAVGIATGSENIKSSVRIMNLRGRYFATDHVSYQGNEREEGMVMPFHAENEYLIDEMRVSPGDKVLEVGVGSGVNSIVALLNGAEHVTALDVNPRTAEYTRFNMALNGIDESRLKIVLNKDTSLDALFDPIEGETFDYLITNPPFEYGRVDDSDALRNSASGSDGLDMIRKIIQKASHYLTDTGRMQMVYFAPGTGEGPTTLIEEAQQLQDGAVEVKYRENSMRTEDFVGGNLGKDMGIPPEHEFYWTGMLHYTKGVSGFEIMMDGTSQKWHLPLQSDVPMGEKHSEIRKKYTGDKK
jgi:16S rRNA G966 N2-methylase RsmD